MQQFHKTPQGSKANFEGNEFWDRRFAESDYVYGTEPNAFFRSVIDRMEPGKLLLPAEGGRTQRRICRHPGLAGRCGGFQ